MISTQNDSEKLLDLFEPPKLLVICKYFIICPNDKCAHFTPHKPLYKGYKDTAPSTRQFVTANCAARPHLTSSCPLTIPKDRECMPINIEEIQAAFELRVKNNKI